MNLHRAIKARAYKIHSTLPSESACAIGEVIGLCQQDTVNQLYKWCEDVKKLEVMQSMVWEDPRMNEIARALYYYQTGIKLDMP